MLNERPRIESPKKLAETIDVVLDFYNYSKDILHKYVICLDVLDNTGTPDELLCRCQDGARRTATLLFDQEPLYPPLPVTQQDPLHDLREIQHWCLTASRVKSEKQAATQTPANGIQGKDEPPQNPSIKKDKYWTFTYKDKTVTVDGALDGCFYIEELLTHPNKEYTATELRFAKIKHDTGKDIDIRQSPQKYIENPDIIKGRIDSLEKEKSKASNPLDIAYYDEQINDLREYLKAGFDLHGKPRKFNNDSDRKSINRTIQTVLEQIKTQHQELYNHFESFLQKGVVCTYKPDSSICWEIL